MARRLNSTVWVPWLIDDTPYVHNQTYPIHDSPLYANQTYNVAAKEVTVISFKDTLLYCVFSSRG